MSVFRSFIFGSLTLAALTAFAMPARADWHWRHGPHGVARGRWKETRRMRVSVITIGFAALMLLSACASGISTVPYTASTFDQAQDACNAGNGAACNAANNLRSQGWRY